VTPRELVAWSRALSLKSRGAVTVCATLFALKPNRVDSNLKYPRASGDSLASRLRRDRTSHDELLILRERS